MFEISVSGQNVCVLDSEASVVYIQMGFRYENGPNEHVEIDMINLIFQLGSKTNIECGMVRNEL